jgi:hypothetical protein
MLDVPVFRERLRAVIKAKRAALKIQQGILPRSELSKKWGHDRKTSGKKFGIPWSKEIRYTPLEMFTIAIHYSPYNPACWTARSYLYYRLGFYDLALGDAHRAERLVNFIVSPLNRTDQKGLNIRVWDAIEQHTYLHRDELPEALHGFRKARTAGPSSFMVPIRKALQHTMALCLLALKSPYDYEAMEQELGNKLIMEKKEQDYFMDRLNRNRKKLNNYKESIAADGAVQEKDVFLQDAERGHLTNRERYPLDDPVDRQSDFVVNRINELYFPPCFPDHDSDPALSMK